MTFYDSIKTCFSKYCVFKGRARRSEYWYFVLFYVLVCVLLFMIEFSVFWLTNINENVLYSVYIVFDGLCFLLLFLPYLSVTIRRLHDTDKNAAYIFLSLIIFVGSIILLIILCKDSDFGDNHYGHNPKGLDITDGGVVFTENNEKTEIEVEDNKTEDSITAVTNKYNQPWKD